MKRRTMYMHTLDGKPASYSDVHSPAVLFAGSRHHPAQPVASLAQIRREQRKAQQEAAKSRATAHWADAKRYGYVLVEVPS